MIGSGKEQSKASSPGRKKRIRLWLLVGIVWSCVVVSLVYIKYLATFRDAIYIGVVAPLTGNYAEAGIPIRDSVKMYFDEVNSKGGINGKEVILIEKDDQNDPKLAKQRAMELAEDGRVVAVIGHRHSGPTLAAKEVYVKYGIPTIAPTASNPLITKNSKWNFRMVFDDVFQAELLAYCVKNVFKAQRVTIIRSNNPYGESLSREFHKGANHIGLNVVTTVTMEQSKPFTPSAEELELIRSSDVVFLSLHNLDALEAVKKLNSESIKVKYIGGDSVGSDVFARTGGRDVEGVYAINFYNTEVMGLKARKFSATFLKKYGYECEWGGATAYDAAFLLAKVIGKVGADRSRIANEFLKINSLNNSYKGVTGNLFFDKDGNCMKMPVFIQVQNGRFRTAEFQMAYVNNSEALAEGVFRFKNYLMRKSIVVRAGVYVTDVEAINVKESSFTVQFLVWFRWSGDLKKMDFGLINGTVLDQKLTAQSDDLVSGERYRCYQVNATIKQDLYFLRYPFDVHALKIKLRHRTLPSTYLQFVNDVATLSLSDRDASFGNWEDIGQVNYVDHEDVLTSFRNPRAGLEREVVEYPVYNYQITFKRIFKTYLMKFLIPLLFIIFMSFLAFFIHPKDLESNINIGITSLLSAIAFHITQADNLPDIGYIVVSDVFFLVAYALILLTLVETVWTYSLYINGNKRLASRIDFYSRYMFTFLLVVTVILIINYMA